MSQEPVKGRIYNPDPRIHAIKGTPPLDTSSFSGGSREREAALRVVVLAEALMEQYVGTGTWRSAIGELQAELARFRQAHPKETT